jgi:glucosamine-6-phosphate deaminase
VRIRIGSTKEATSACAAAEAAEALREAIRERGEARLILATGASQFSLLEALVAAPDVDWSRVTMFHLDEYIGMALDHPASFRRYLWERFVMCVPPLAATRFIEGDAPDVEAECDRVGALITEAPIDVACIGIGENGHIAFNDPPADFDTERPFIIVDLDEKCRRQQLGEGWFRTLDDVPTRAVSMSIRQILASRRIVCTVPDERKAVAVRDTLEGGITNLVPASILRTHPACTLYLDDPAASLLAPATRDAAERLAEPTSHP